MNEPFATLDWTRLVLRRTPSTWRGRLQGWFKYWGWLVRRRVQVAFAIAPRRGKLL